ncbi:hypothetical protein L1987_53160 [Smallanthus sonchifolius]|uniref:Uncharacterized protein n=1 Tax=Smallanthus sonchifolius TaxID=185202 RepID=A0ACB9EUU2_9ASTR|nr:hypothetical protein L1987_53160 [Smallanthus sonchifolius]
MTLDKNLENKQDLSVEEQGKQRITEQDNTSEYIYDRPHFSIGLTQLESTGCDGETKQMEERNSTKKDDGNEDFVTGKVRERWEQMMKDKETDWPKRIERFILNMKRVVDWNPALMDLRGIDMVLLPMLENDHYYLIVFELKHTCISVIDNFSDAYPLVRLNDHEDYFQKDSSYKVIEALGK